MTGAEDDSDDTGRLLIFLCGANVCRSPAMEFLTTRPMRELDVGQSWRFMSAGTSAVEAQRMCSSSAAALRGLPGGEAFVEAKRSHRLTPELVARAGLIVVATREERSAVARLAPEARSRTFTMVEAALLAESAAARDMGPTGGGPVTLGQLAALLHDNRGVLVAEHPSWVNARLRGRSYRPPTLDIGDVHTGGARTHRPVLRDVRWASQHLTGALHRVLGR